MHVSGLALLWLLSSLINAETRITTKSFQWCRGTPTETPHRSVKQPASEEHLWLQKTDLCTVTSFKFRLNFQSNPFPRWMWGDIPFCSALTVKCQTILQTISSGSSSVCLTARHGLNRSRGSAANCLTSIRHWSAIEVWLVSNASFIQLSCGHVALFSFDLFQSVSRGHVVWPPHKNT